MNSLSKARIELLPATLEQKPVFANLLELYSHDFSEFIDLEIGVDGRFGYRDLDLYWTDANRWPFLLYADGKLAGFILVQRIAQNVGAVWDVAEFFMLRGFRRGGIGTRAAMEIFARFPGLWQVRVMRVSGAACRFWAYAVHAFAGQTVRLSYATAHGREWMVYSFASPPPA